MNRYLGNICISAVSAVAGGTIAHLTDAQIIKNLENQNEKLEEKNIKYKLHIIKLNKIISYYETKYNEKVEITEDGKIKSNLDTIDEDSISEDSSEENIIKKLADDCDKDNKTAIKIMYENPEAERQETDENPEAERQETDENPETDDDESDKTNESKTSFESLNLEEIKEDLSKES